MTNIKLQSIGLTALLSSAVMALDIKDGPHGGITSASINDNSEVCVYCHTPHASRNGDGAIPLWNKPITNLESTNGFTMYGATSTNIPGRTLAGTQTTAQPQSQTLACLSCHDGVSAMNSVINAPGAGLTGSATTYANGVLIGDTLPKVMYPFSFLAVGLGGDLTDDHPVSIEYIPGRASLREFNYDLTNFFGANIVSDLLRDGKVQCVSCHDPHGTGNPRYLRVDNGGSMLCFGCHDK